MKKIAIAITGASGSIYAQLLLKKLEALKEQIAELSIVITDNAKFVWQTEIGNSDYNKFSARYFDKKDFTAPFASGSAKYDALIIIPCSMGTLGRIAGGISNDFLKAYNITAFPRMVIFDRAGKIVSVDAPVPRTPESYRQLWELLDN